MILTTWYYCKPRGRQKRHQLLGKHLQSSQHIQKQTPPYLSFIHPSHIKSPKTISNRRVSRARCFHIRKKGKSKSQRGHSMLPCHYLKKRANLKYPWYSILQIYSKYTLLHYASVSQRTCNSRIQKIRTRKERMGTDKPEEAKLTSREGQPTKLTNQRLSCETIGYFPQSQQNTRLLNCRRFCPKQNVSITKKTRNRTRKNFNVTLTPWSKKNWNTLYCILKTFL